MTPRRLVLTFCALGLVAGCASAPPSAADVLARASKAMGSAQLKSLRYAGEGEGFTFGQAYLPTGPWPKVAYHAVTRTIDYEAGAMRDEVTLSRAEPRGGGGYPLSGQQRNDQFVSGSSAWNVAGGNVAPGARFIADRVHQLWITPHGVLMAAQRNAATLSAGEGGTHKLSFTQPGRLRAVATVSADGLVTRVDSTYPDPVMGDTAVTTTYADYKDFSGVKFPTRVRQAAGGYPTLDLTIKEVQPNAPVTALALPDAARSMPAERVVSEKVADGVWHFAGGSHNSVLVEMSDHLVLVETPLNDARTQAVIDHAKQLVPNKPIRFAVNSHAHFDHSGGVRAAVAEGATIVTMAGNVPYFERVFGTPNALAPDRMAQAGRPARLQGVSGDKGMLSDGTRTIELHKIAGGPHSDTMLMAYLPKEKLLIQADAYTPLAAEYASADDAEREQRQPDRQHRAPEAGGGSHPAAAWACRAGGRSVHHSESHTAAALTALRHPAPWHDGAMTITLQAAAVVVVGGGPAGLMAAEVLADAGIAVHLYDAMPSVGRKFLLAGKGGLNLTHSEALAAFVQRYGARAPQVAAWLDAFSPEGMRAWAATLGIETFVGTSGRVFPRDLKAAPLLRAWLHRLRQRGVVFHMRHRWCGWSDDGALRFATPRGDVHLSARTTVLALGGASWPQLGSDAAWVPWLRAAGAELAPLAPANCGFEVAWSDHLKQRFSGAPIKPVLLRFGDVFERQGEFVLSAYGIEGSLVYAASSMIRDAIACNGSATITLDLLPAHDSARVAREVAHPRGSRSLSSHLKSRLGLEGAKAALLHEVLPREVLADAARLAVAIKALPITLAAPRPIAEAISSAGGVTLESLDAQLMLRERPGVFCAGEMLDWEAPTGGYLLQASMASGRVAGAGAARWLTT